MVETRYLTSAFLNEAKAENILENFKKSLQPLTINQLLQVSMDGPNVNWKFMQLLDEEEYVNVTDIGSCGLHFLHVAYQSDHKAANWTINGFLTGIYWLFKDSTCTPISFLKISEQ